jgi:hypothetical protein
MREHHPIWPAPRRRRWATAVMAAALMTSVVGTAWAQDALDETEIEIVVHPSGALPTPTPTTPAPNPVVPPPAPQPGPPPIVVTQTSVQPPVLGAIQAPVLLPGTVSAQIALVQPHGATDRLDDTVTTLVVRDDRGTAAGWDVGFASEPPEDVVWQPEMIENRSVTIRRLMPPQDNQSSDQEEGIGGGRTLGPYEVPIPVLTAETGSGSGLYQQQLIVVVPILERDDDSGTVFVQLPFAP